MRAWPIRSALLPWRIRSAHSITHSITPSEEGGSVSVHGGALGVAAELPLRRRTDGPAATRVAAGGAAFLQSQKLLGTEGLVVNLASGFHQILQVGASEEVAQVDELAVVLVLDVDNTPASRRFPSGSKRTVSPTRTSTSLSPATAVSVSPMRLRPFLMSARAKERPSAAEW